MDNSLFMDQHDFMDSLDEDFTAAFGQNLHNYMPTGTSSAMTNIPNSNSSYTSSAIEQAKPHIPEDNFSKFSSIQNVMINPDDQVSSAPMIISFGNQNNPSHNFQQVSTVNPMPTINPEEHVVARNGVLKALAKVQSTKKRTRVRAPSQTYDHIIAERKRREQLSQLFVALSAIVPGLKKMDKSSILEDAIKYLKHLKERVQKLEEQAEQRAMESVVLVRKSQMVVEDEGSSDEQISGCFAEQPLPAIEARVCDKHILIRVHCEKKKGVLVKLLCKVESLNMIIVNTNATPFGNVSLDITIIAELEKEFNMTVKEVVTAIRAALMPGA
ncbi:hypothetical protein CDL12_17345 [Handroanthus impetiginosus]|uniref:BHLH domain-containing protein n=1 Tax=Handroanthus impetiginosus TaxID=429701 RepID=A0A2G9GXQ6_9LAMI|nr:hypothetical protein CDL12_17345 [Handroanthus impetiginosus]